MTGKHRWHTSGRVVVALAFVGVLVVLLCTGAENRTRTVDCTLEKKVSRAFAGPCVFPLGRTPPGLEGVLELSEPSGSGFWTGSMKIGADGHPRDVELVPPSDSDPGVIKTPFNWVVLDRFEVSGKSLRIVFSLDNEAQPSKSDLEIVLRAAEILSDAAAWDRADDRVCKPSDTAWSLYCALRRATEEVVGRSHHRQPALQVVRVVVREKVAERITNHRLMNFNNHPETTLAEVQDVLRVAARRIKADLAESR